MNKIEELKNLLNDPRTGLKDSSDTNKTRYAILALFEEHQDMNKKPSEIIRATAKGLSVGEPITTPLDIVGRRVQAILQYLDEQHEKENE